MFWYIVGNIYNEVALSFLLSRRQNLAGSCIKLLLSFEALHAIPSGTGDVPSGRGRLLNKSSKVNFNLAKGQLNQNLEKRHTIHISHPIMNLDHSVMFAIYLL